jgi:hypothetical protein
VLQITGNRTELQGIFCNGTDANNKNWWLCCMKQLKWLTSGQVTEVFTQCLWSIYNNQIALRKDMDTLIFCGPLCCTAKWYVWDRIPPKCALSQKKNWFPRSFHATEVTKSPSLEKSHNLGNARLRIYQRYTQLPNPTLTIFFEDQSTRFRWKSSRSSGVYSVKKGIGDIFRGNSLSDLSNF